MLEFISTSTYSLAVYAATAMPNLRVHIHDNCIDA